MKSRYFFAAVLLMAFGSTRVSAQTAQTLTLQDAEKIAIQNHPRVQAAQDIAVAASQRVREAKSNYYPTADGSLTGVEAENGSRISAGALNNPIIYDRFADGVEVSQLVTDFGRTHELVKSSNYRAKAEVENVTATRADVLLRVDQSYFGLLKARAVLKVAQETVADRQLVSDQITALAKNQLKSDLDVSFANVDLAQAQLLLVQAQNDLQAANAELSAALGYNDQRTFQLVEQPMPAAPPTSLPDMIQEALRDRPEIVGQKFNVTSAQSYATAERDLSLPTISAVGAAGLAPYRADQLESRYAAAGFNVNIPIFNGHLYGALRAEASAEARAQQQYLRDTEDSIVRDVQKAWLNANSGYQRLALTDQLLAQASEALKLAQARYKLGLSAIVELSQAQLNLTQAEIEQASARYDYQTELSALNYQLGAIH
ncbi:MAG: TolC family protein [Candidatus Acidiferrales bacterium]